jgi:FkbM family methyltransferase
MSRRYYSQHGEDFLLWHLFTPEATGFYVDVGAFDGVHLSNTYSFEQIGWSGICIEPHPTYFPICARNRPRATCLHMACVGDEDVKSTEFFTEKLGLLSGTMDQREDDVAWRYARKGLDFDGFERVTVPARTLNAILEEHLPNGTEISFVSFDVEGAELEVLRGFDLARYRPRALVIEANTESQRRAIAGAVALHGYIEARQVGFINFVFVRERQDVGILQQVVIDCELEKSIHPLGENYTETRFLQKHRFHEEAPQRPRTSRSYLRRAKRFLRKYMGAPKEG